jgi:hypothetical protein
VPRWLPIPRDKKMEKLCDQGEREGEEIRMGKDLFSP